MNPSDTQIIKEALPNGWKMLHGQESWGTEHYGVAILVRAPAEPSEETKTMAYGFGHKLDNEIRKDKVREDPKTEENKATQRKDLLACFGSLAIYVEEIPNEYWGEDSPYALSSPWLIVTTKIGHIRIGWRKKVIVVDYSRSNVETPAALLFPNEDSTKDGQMIHAWGYDKATEYIQKLHKEKTSDE